MSTEFRSLRRKEVPMRTRENQHGVVSILVMMLLTLFLTSAIALLEMEQGAYKDVHNIMQTDQARFLAESGLQEAKYYAEVIDGSFSGVGAEQVVTVGNTPIGSYQYTISK